MSESRQIIYSLFLFVIVCMHVHVSHAQLSFLCRLCFVLLFQMYPSTQFVVTGILGPSSNAHGPNEVWQ